MEVITPKLVRCRIREFHEDDLEACLDIHRSNEPDYLEPGGIHGFVEFLARGTSYYLVIEHEGKIIACGGLELAGDSGHATLLHGMVHRKHHGQGFGTTLLAARLSLLEHEDDLVPVWVHAGLTSVPFYGRFGFSLHSITPNPVGPERELGIFWLNVSPEEIEAIRAALNQRGIQIELNPPVEDSAEEPAA
jgi:N-acetylglutamate synthase-like GNAT family acetyltransferase